MSDLHWKRIDLGLLERGPWCLEDGDNCFHAREYMSHGGYEASETNQLITNLKWGLEYRNTPRWPHKLRAIDRWSEELSTTIQDGDTVACIPCSKCRSDPHYDPRVEWILEALQKRREIRTERPIERVISAQSMHSGGDRHPDLIYECLGWKGFEGDPPDMIILIDDVITSGASFKACQRLILEHHRAMEVCGLFWARTIERPDPLDFEISL